MSTSRAPLGAAASWGRGAGFGSGSRIRALNPLPSAFLAIGNNLLGQANVARRPRTMHVIEYNRLTVTRSFRQANIARDYSLKDLLSEEATQIGAHLLGKRCALVVHGE